MRARVIVAALAVLVAGAPVGAVRPVNQNIPLTTVDGDGVVPMRAQRSPQDQFGQATRLVRWAVSLPADASAVGRPPVTVRRSTAGAGSSAPASPSASPATHGIGKGGALGGLVLLLLLGGTVLLAARVRRAR